MKHQAASVATLVGCLTLAITLLGSHWTIYGNVHGFAAAVVERHGIALPYLNGPEPDININVLAGFLPVDLGDCFTSADNCGWGFGFLEQKQLWLPALAVLCVVFLILLAPYSASGR